MLVFSIGTLNESEKPFCRYEGDKVWVRPHTSTPVDTETKSLPLAGGALNSCSETNTKAAMRYRQSAILNLIYRSANFVMGQPYVTQDSLLCKDSEIISKLDTSRPFLIYIFKICHVLSLCNTKHII